ncbi:MAG: GNAT family N-acetyltransferase [Coleofasciculus sp. S288]|nr:GNAT family N-acetyltransferase [Coleofasciculus sp. S288]
MTSPVSDNAKNVIRAVQYRDLEAIESLALEATEADGNSSSVGFVRQLQQLRRWYGLLKFLSWFPNPYQYNFCMYVAEAFQQIRGLIKVSPFNRARSTWRVEQVLVDPNAPQLGNRSASLEIGSGLLRYCFETIWEARTWILEVNIHHQSTLALYRQNGFQPLAQLTYWAIAPEVIAELAEHEPDLPNLLPVSNAEAQLLYQLDTASMPPLVRQVFDRHLQDFKTSFVGALLSQIQQWFTHTEVVRGYVFEPQRKAAIGYFQVKMCRNGDRAHEGELTVHPAYTDLYPELLAQMARIVQECPPQLLQLASADYQSEREEYLEQLGAERIEHTLLMSRSVWHKLREAKPVSLEGLQLSEVLQGLQPARTPVPSRIAWWKSISKKPHVAAKMDKSGSASASPSSISKEAKPSSESLGAKD